MIGEFRLIFFPVCTYAFLVCSLEGKREFSSISANDMIRSTRGENRNVISFFFLFFVNLRSRHINERNVYTACTNIWIVIETLQKVNIQYLCNTRVSDMKFYLTSKRFGVCMRLNQKISSQRSFFFYFSFRILK